MTKKSFLSLLLSVFVANFLMLNAANWKNNLPCLADTCEAPPPDSFRIVDAGAHFVNLAWKPVDPMATYTIVVQKEVDNANTWEDIETIPNVSGSSITIQNLLYGSKYQFEMATNCGNGDPSILKVYAGPPIGVILDLVLNGRTPVNPSPVPNCQDIVYENFNWVGFKVESAQGLGAASNLFEFKIGTDGVPQIKRVKYGPQIVATDFEGLFPEVPPGFPIVELDAPTFLMKRVDGAVPIKIGKVLVLYNPVSNPKTVQFCKEDFGWPSGYTFTPMTALISNGLKQSGGYENFSSIKEAKNEVKVLNPVYDFIQISIDSGDYEDTEYSIQVVDLTGRVVFQKKGVTQGGEIQIFTEKIPSGIYSMTLFIHELVETYKIIKI